MKLSNPPTNLFLLERLTEVKRTNLRNGLPDSPRRPPRPYRPPNEPQSSPNAITKLCHSLLPRPNPLPREQSRPEISMASIVSEVPYYLSFCGKASKNTVAMRHESMMMFQSYTAGQMNALESDDLEASFAVAECSSFSVD
jgi:hypothetical protein